MSRSPPRRTGRPARGAASRTAPPAPPGRSVKRSPITHAPSAARSLTRSRSASLTPHRGATTRDSPANGSDGWLSTGASIRSSTIMPRAKPPVKHMPTAPTPGPPHSSCALAASARSQPTIGLVCPVAKTVNSRATQARGQAVRRTVRHGRPGVPNSYGRYTVKPAVDHPAGELDHAGMHARDLVDHDDGRSGASPVDVALDARRGRTQSLEAIQSRDDLGRPGRVSKAPLRHV